MEFITAQQLATRDASFRAYSALACLLLLGCASTGPYVHVPHVDDRQHESPRSVLESFQLDAQAGGEALYYSVLTAADAPADNRDGTTYDYTGRRARLEYDVDPIVLAAAQLSLSFDAVGFQVGYATDRVYSSGGTLQNGVFTRKPGVHTGWNDTLAALLDVAGVRVGGRLAHFTNGVVRATGDSGSGEMPFEFRLRQIDVSYDYASMIDFEILQTLAIGLRYFDYTVPRILYELVNTTPEADDGTFVYVRESPVQAVRSQYLMVNFATRFEDLDEVCSLFFSMDTAAGIGPSRYYFLQNPGGGDVEHNREYAGSTSLSVGFASALGVRYRFAGERSRFNAYAEAFYQVQLIGVSIDSRDDGNTVVKTGGVDVFHGPSLAFGMAF